jgi:uncharacterized membrane protein
VATPRRRTVYHRLLGWHAHAMRRALTIIAVGVVVTLVLLAFVPWELAAILGWDAAATTFIVTAWHLISQADSADTQRLAGEASDTRTRGTVLLVLVCLLGLIGAGFALGFARTQGESFRWLLIGIAALTVALSWAMLNTVYTLRYAHLYYGPKLPGIRFDDRDSDPSPTYRDFAYLAFTIGMTYQVSDTILRDSRTRRTVMVQALLAYVFGVVIIAGAINLAAALI